MSSRAAGEGAARSGPRAGRKINGWVRLQHPTERSYWLSDAQWPAMLPRPRRIAPLLARILSRPARSLGVGGRAPMPSVAAEVRSALKLNEASPQWRRKSKGAVPAPPQAAWRGIGRAGCARRDPFDVGAVPAVAVAVALATGAPRREHGAMTVSQD